MHTAASWNEAIAAMNAGEKIEVDVALFDYFLEVLPPVYMNRWVTLPCGERRVVSYGFAEGAEQVKAFWEADGKYYCQQTKEMNRAW
jgi:hypothetical protein